MLGFSIFKPDSKTTNEHKLAQYLVSQKVYCSELEEILLTSPVYRDSVADLRAKRLALQGDASTYMKACYVVALELSSGGELLAEYLVLKGRMFEQLKVIDENAALVELLDDIGQRNTEGLLAGLQALLTKPVICNVLSREVLRLSLFRGIELVLSHNKQGF